MPPSRVPRPVAFWAVAALLVLVLAASAAPSPLYRVYQAQFGFSAGVLTTVFGIYVFALLAALLTVGGLSDHVGRRPVLAAGLVVQIAAMLLFLVADGVGWLLAARVVQGLATGALLGVLGAALLDFQDAGRPLGALLNSVSPGIGLAAGALGAGVLLEFTAAPTAWVFGVLVAVFGLALAGLALLPESSPRRPGARGSLRPQVHVPAPQRAAFLAALPCLVALWALSGLYLSLGPSLAGAVFGLDGHLVASLLLVAMTAPAAVASVAVRGLAPELAMAGGALVFAVGTAGTVAALVGVWTPLLFASTAVSGLGFGAAFLGAIASITAGVAPGARAGLLSAGLVVGYLAFSVPAIAAGVVAGAVGLHVTAEVYGVVVIVLALVAVAGILLRRRARERADAQAPAPSPGLAARALPSTAGQE